MSGPHNASAGRAYPASAVVAPVPPSRAVPPGHPAAPPPAVPAQAVPAARPVPATRTGRAAKRPAAPQPRVAAPVGRVEIVSHANDILEAGGSVLLRGPAGIGKSTILETLARQRGDATILRVAAAEVESGLPYLTLVDLFGGVLASGEVMVRGHLRAALDAALLRSAAPATAQDELAVRLAVLELLRSLATRGPVLLVIDDLPWVDEPSAGVLQFVARRLDGLPVQMIAAARVTGDEVIPRAELCPPPCTELTLPSLGADDVADVLRARFGERLNRSAILRVHAASGGNPLFALELGRAVAERGEPITLAEPLPVPDRLRVLLTARIAALPTVTRQALVVAAAAARPTRDLLERTGVPLSEGLRVAIDSGVIAIGGDGSVRFTHPLLREMVYADATPEERVEAHDRLAAGVDDPVEGARHLALARPERDEALAVALADAATVAQRRGAPAIAADLAQLAAERSVDANAAVGRRVDAAMYAYDAGMTGEAKRLAHAALEVAVDPAVRVRLRLLLIELQGQDLSHVGPVLDDAYADAGLDPALGALVRLYRGNKALYDNDFATAAEEFEWSRRLAESSGDRETLIRAMALLATVGRPAGAPPIDEPLVARAASIARSLPMTSSVLEVRLLHAMTIVRWGEAAEGVAEMEAIRSTVERGGSVNDLSATLVTIAVAYSRTGRLAEALATGRAAVRLFSDLDVTPGPGLVAGASGELNGGSLGIAGTYADQAIAASVAAGDDDWLKSAYFMKGQILLLQGDPAGAAEQMRRSWEMQRRRGSLDLGMTTWHPDFVEALIASGARAEAAEVLAELTVAVEELHWAYAEVSLARARGLLLAAEGDPRAGVAEITDALAAWPNHPYPLEIARAWHVIGIIERRAHRRGAAREALGEAIARYGKLGARPWLAAAEAELAKLNGPRGMGLSETEQRIVDLVRLGHTNREIARTTFLSVKAIEANLTRLYRRYGVRNRDQLSRVVSEMSTD